MVGAATANPAAGAVRMPGHDELFSLELPAPLQALRQRAREVQAAPQGALPELTISDALQWELHTPDEHWLLWRARRTVGRLRAMHLELEPGETLVGKPHFRPPSAEEQEKLKAAGQILASMPAFPGGDPGHFHPDWEKILRLGIGGLRDEVAALAVRPGLTDEQQNVYAACALVLEGLADFAVSIADTCEQMASNDPADAVRWRGLAAMNRRLAAHPPATFHEALQLMWLTTVALWFAEDHHLTTPGRMDQTLRGFYEADLSVGRTTRREAFELICCLFIHCNRILWPGSAISVMVGGRDASGRDVTNELTYLCLAARQATRLVYPTVGVVWYPGCPDELLDFSVRMLASGVGCPALFNGEVIAAGLRDHGVTEPDCANFMNSTCVEIKVCGASNMWVTQPYFNCPKALLDEMAGVARGESPAPETFDELQARLRDRLATTIRDAAQRLDAIWRRREEVGGFPLASCVISDCLERGADYDRGGARYNWVENSFVGLANLVDSLTAVRHLVYDSGELTLPEFHAILQADWEGHEPLRQRVLNALPQYGNDDPAADSLAAEWAQFLIDSTKGNQVGPHRYVPGFFCWVMHERMGSETGATPDGRLCGLPLADGAGGAQGREHRGPTAAALSSTSWSHRAVLGGLVHNAKFPASVLRTERDLRALRAVLETYLQRGGFEIQVNVVGTETLLDAQAHPEMHQDLLVRVAGYSDYFVHLNRKMQDEVIARTEHAL
jgi:pyruvate-formate lyase